MFEFCEMTKEEARKLNPLVLAYIGDSVYELYIRGNLLLKGRDKNAHKLHLEAISYVKAKAQSDIIKKMEEKLTDEELDIFKRGRNAKSKTSPKNADIIDYRMATGFEALIGYLFIIGRKERITELLNFSVNV